MREYGQVQCAFWTSQDFRETSDEARLLALYLLTGPHSNGLGCYWLPEGYAQADLGWPSETLSKGFEELFRNGFCKRCESTHFVLIFRYLKWNPVTNPNVAKARIAEFERVSKKSEVFNDLVSSMISYGNHWPNGFETLSKRYSKQDQTKPNQINTCPSGMDERFLGFWENYPRKESKSDAQKAFRNLTKTEQLAAINGLTNFSFAKEKQFQPLAATWIRKRRWEDEPDEPTHHDPLDGMVIQ